jgi:hypothetical protein
MRNVLAEKILPEFAAIAATLPQKDLGIFSLYLSVECAGSSTVLSLD